MNEASPGPGPGATGRERKAPPLRSGSGGSAAPLYLLVVETAPSGAAPGERREPPASYGIESRETVIGRDPACAIRLDDDFVSRRHARLLLRDHELRLEDLGSTNGTHRNGDLVETRVELRPGDEVRVGRSLCRIASSAGTDTAPAEDLGAPADPEAAEHREEDDAWGAADDREGAGARREGVEGGESPDYVVVGPLPGEPRGIRRLVLALGLALAVAITAAVLLLQ